MKSELSILLFGTALLIVALLALYGLLSVRMERRGWGFWKRGMLRLPVGTTLLVIVCTPLFVVSSSVEPDGLNFPPEIFVSFILVLFLTFSIFAYSLLRLIVSRRVKNANVLLS